METDTREQDRFEEFRQNIIMAVNENRIVFDFFVASRPYGEEALPYAEETRAYNSIIDCCESMRRLRTPGDGALSERDLEHCNILFWRHRDIFGTHEMPTVYPGTLEDTIGRAMSFLPNEDVVSHARTISETSRLYVSQISHIIWLMENFESVPCGMPNSNHQGLIPSEQREANIANARRCLSQLIREPLSAEILGQRLFAANEIERLYLYEARRQESIHSMVPYVPRYVNK